MFHESAKVVAFLRYMHNFAAHMRERNKLGIKPNAIVERGLRQIHATKGSNTGKGTETETETDSGDADAGDTDTGNANPKGAKRKRRDRGRNIGTSAAIALALAEAGFQETSSKVCCFSCRV